jgi:hypothetical protein
MEEQQTLSNWVVGTGTAMVAFAVPHFVDDFLYGIPAEFGLSNPQAQVLGGLFFAALTAALILAGRGHRSGYYGTLVIGAFLVAAASLGHLDGILAAQPYWGGFISEASILGIIASGLGLAITSLLALRRSSRERL